MALCTEKGGFSFIFRDGKCIIRTGGYQATKFKILNKERESAPTAPQLRMIRELIILKSEKSQMPDTFSGHFCPYKRWPNSHFCQYKKWPNSHFCQYKKWPGSHRSNLLVLFQRSPCIINVNDHDQYDGCDNEADGDHHALSWWPW